MHKSNALHQTKLIRKSQNLLNSNIMAFFMLYDEIFLVIQGWEIKSAYGIMKIMKFFLGKFGQTFWLQKKTKM